MIMNGRASLRLPWVGLLCLALVGAATLPAWATGGQQPVTQSQTTPPVPVVKPVTPAEPVHVERRTLVHPAVVVERHVQTVPVRPVVVPTPAQPRQAARHVAVTPSPFLQRDVRVTVPEQSRWVVFSHAKPAQLTEEGQKLVQAFQTEREAIQVEADKKIQARQDALTKDLQALLDQYTKAGKLDEAVAIRDYLRSLSLHRPVIRR